MEIKILERWHIVGNNHLKGVGRQGWGEWETSMVEKAVQLGVVGGAEIWKGL